MRRCTPRSQCLIQDFPLLPFLAPSVHRHWVQSRRQTTAASFSIRDVSWGGNEAVADQAAVHHGPASSHVSQRLLKSQRSRDYGPLATKRPESICKPDRENHRHQAALSTTQTSEDIASQILSPGRYSSQRRKRRKVEPLVHTPEPRFVVSAGSDHRQSEVLGRIGPSFDRALKPDHVQGSRASDTTRTTGAPRESIDEEDPKPAKTVDSQTLDIPTKSYKTVTPQPEDQYAKLRQLLEEEALAEAQAKKQEQRAQEEDAMRLAQRLKAPRLPLDRDTALREAHRQKWFYYRRQQYMRDLIAAGRAEEIPEEYRTTIFADSRRLFELTYEEWREYWGMAKVENDSQTDVFDEVHQNQQPQEGFSPTNDASSSDMATPPSQSPDLFKPRMLWTSMFARSRPSSRRHFSTQSVLCRRAQCRDASEPMTEGRPSTVQWNTKVQAHVSVQEQKEMDENLEDYPLIGCGIETYTTETTTRTAESDQASHSESAIALQQGMIVDSKGATSHAHSQEIDSMNNALPQVRPWRRIESRSADSQIWSELYVRLAVAAGMSPAGSEKIKHPRLAADEYEEMIYHQQIQQRIWEAFDLCASDAASWSTLEIKTKWPSLNDDDRQRFWPLIMLETLQRAPEHAADFLMVTHLRPYPDSRAVADAFGFLVQTTWAKERRNANQLLSLCCTLLDRGKQSSPPFRQSAIGPLVDRCREEGLHDLYTKLQAHEIALHPETILRFVFRLAPAGDWRRAYVILQDAISSKGDLNREVFQRASSLIMSEAARQGVDDESMIQLVDDLVTSGIGLSTSMKNVLVKRFLEKDDMERAMQLVRSMQQDPGHPPDAVTHVIVLQDAKRRKDNAGVLQAIAMAEQSGLIQKDVNLATEYLDATRKLLHDRPIEYRWKDFSGEYDRLFESDLAGKLRILRSSPWNRLIRRLKPDRITNALVINTYVRYAWQLRESRLPAVYKRFLELLEAGDHEAVETCSSREVWHSFLSAFRHVGDYDLCIRVVQDMAKDRKAKSGLAVSGPRPDVITWSMLVHALFRQGDHRSGEKILSMMDEQNVVPDALLWNNLLKNSITSWTETTIARILLRMRRARVNMSDDNQRRMARLKGRVRILELVDGLERGKRVVVPRDDNQFFSPASPELLPETRSSSEDLDRGEPQEIEAQGLRLSSALQ